MEFTIDLPDGIDSTKRLECIKKHGAYNILNMALELDSFIGRISYCHPGFRRLSQVIIKNPEILGLKSGFHFRSESIQYSDIRAVRKEYKQTKNYKTVVIPHNDIFTAEASYNYEAYDEDDDRYVDRCASARLIIPITVIDNTITDTDLRSWAKKRVVEARGEYERILENALNKLKKTDPKLFAKVIAKYV